MAHGDHASQYLAWPSWAACLEDLVRLNIYWAPQHNPGLQNDGAGVQRSSLMPSGKFQASSFPAFASFTNSCESPDLHKTPWCTGCTVHHANLPSTPVILELLMCGQS